ncbi:MAG: hypothetical protein IBGAMO2_110003 [Arenicellales bacterium IbO2]|nr:MAG: hypothetical protein IBGAMO2_110003 [Arenicellales bacterium IbO2]
MPHKKPVSSALQKNPVKKQTPSAASGAIRRRYLAVSLGLLPSHYLANGKLCRLKTPCQAFCEKIQ